MRGPSTKCPTRMSHVAHGSGGRLGEQIVGRPALGVVAQPPGLDQQQASCSDERGSDGDELVFLILDEARVVIDRELAPRDQEGDVHRPRSAVIPISGARLESDAAALDARMKVLELVELAASATLDAVGGCNSVKRDLEGDGHAAPYARCVPRSSLEHAREALVRESLLLVFAISSSRSFVSLESP
jgi:hypothetical protein